MISQKIRIMLVDDHVMVRHGMRSLINSEPDMRVVAETDSVDKVLEALSTSFEVDVLLLDIALKDKNSIDYIKILIRTCPCLPVLIVTMHDEKVYAARALNAGARGFVMKQEPGEILIAAIREVQKGNLYVSPEVMAQNLRQGVKATPGAEKLDSELTHSELKILKLIAAGFSSTEIASLTNRSIKTIEAHRANIRHKLGLKNSAELIRYAALNHAV